MLIKDILELSLQPNENIASIAKSINGLSEKRLRDALKALQCEPIGSGKKGWHFIGENKLILEESIFDFIPKATAKKTKTNASNKKVIAVSLNANDSGEKANTSDKKAIKKQPIEIDVIDAILAKQAASDGERRTYQGFYADKDVWRVIQSIKGGNKSDFINAALRKVMKEKGLLDD